MIRKHIISLFLLLVVHYNAYCQYYNNLIRHYNTITEPPNYSYLSISGSTFYQSYICDSTNQLKLVGNAERIKKDFSDDFSSVVEGGLLSINYYQTARFPKNQLSIILPLTGLPNQYVFVLSDETPNLSRAFTPDKGLRAYFVDMNLNGGVGKVINQEVLIKGPAQGVTAVRNGGNYWVISRHLDTLIAIPLSSTGFGTPVKTFAPERMDMLIDNGFQYASNINLKSNNKGDVFLSTSCKSSNGKVDSAFLFKYNFNLTTGQFSNQILVYSADMSKTGSYLFTDAVFSPNDSIAYVIGFTPLKFNPADSFYLDVFQLYPKTSTNLWADRFKITHNLLMPRFRYINLSSCPGICLANNRKIYFESKRSSISPNYGITGIINFPDRIGNACGANDSLTNHITSYCSFPFMLHDGFVHFSAEVNCKQAVFRNISDSIFSSYQWYFGDGDSLLSNNAVVSHTYTQPGKYLVKLKGTRPSGYVQWYSDSIDIGPDVMAGFTTTGTQACRYTQVQFTDTSVTAYHNPLTGPRYFWNFGDGTTDTLKNPKHIYTQTGLFNITLIYSNGYCIDTLIRSQAIEVIDAAKPGILLPNDKHCAPTKILVQLQYNSNNIDSVFYQSSTGWDTAYKYTSNTPLAIFFSDSGSFVIRQQLKSSNGCLTTDSALITVYPGFNLSTSPVMHSINVTGLDSILLQWYTLKGAIAYELLRNNGTLSTLSDTFFLDRAAASNTIYAYTIRATDVCNQKSNLSPVSSNLLLRAVPDNNGKVQLSWNTYVYWNSGVENYSVQYQRPDSFVDITLINTLAFEDSSLYSDTLIDIAKCYRVTAQQNNSTASAKSNLVCIPFIPQLWIPDAFSPNPTKDQLNNCWSIENVGVEEFYLEIYNRWGERIFKTADKNFCWDGNYQNKPSPDGVYFYIVRAKGKARLAFEKKGMIYLTR